MLYSKIEDCSSEDLLDRSSEASFQFRSTRSRKWLWTIANSTLFVSSLILLTITYLKSHRPISEHEVQRKSSMFSPVFDSIELPTHIKTASGTLFAPPDASRFRNALAPDPGVDQAWEDLEPIRVFPITKDDVRKLGKDPELAVKFPSEYGLGEEAYMGQIDMFHQIHCLNLLRHLAWAEYNRDGITPKKPFSDLHWLHLGHCTHIVMESLMCYGNLDVITYNWMEGEEKPFPDFNIQHKCRDFDAIVQWQEEHSVPLMWGRNVTRPLGAKEVKRPEGLTELLQGASVHHDHS